MEISFAYLSTPLVWEVKSLISVPLVEESGDEGKGRPYAGEFRLVKPFSIISSQSFYLL